MVSQSEFRAALLDPRQTVPEGLSDPKGRGAGRRFDVYRNNVAVSLTEALETGFPVLAKLLGPETFRSLAGLFLRAHPPASPVLMFYGAAMPGFLEGFAPLAHLPYLSDVARLELALRQSYHAADAAPMDPARLAALDPAVLVSARLRLAPAATALASPWPILGIWRRNMVDGAPRPEIRPEEVLIVRPEFDPEPVLLPTGGTAFITALARGQTIGAALDGLPEGFDLAATLTALVSGGAITDLEVSP